MPWLLYPWEITPLPTETIKETSRIVRLEQVNKWRNSMLARWWWLLLLLLLWPTEQEAGWAVQAVQMFWKSEKSLAPDRIQAPDCPHHGTVTIPIKLSHLPLIYQDNMHCPDPEEVLVIRTIFMQQHPRIRHLPLSWWCLSYQTYFHPKNWKCSHRENRVQ
jgi:hypothetical protein